MSSETKTHRERPVNKAPLLDRLRLSQSAVRLQKIELATVRARLADLFFSNSEIIIDSPLARE